ncbi:hypothetical protein EHO57_13935 [Leptospira langatensis]|uniref:Tail tape measure protein n=1 Tax=Leptospira langatensis TaxID=2484983 RepID=A0A5R2AT02_9LEPT|nr:hypothetical protein [Leptospira langatensis]TGJ99856.1 hypothetical protein EHO57_13935 [Leptospira langatensis]
MADDNSLDITVHGKPDLKDVDREFDRIAKKAKKGIKVKPQAEGKSPQGRNQSSGKESAAKSYGRGANLASKSGADGSDLDETARGGFFDTVDRKIDTIRELRDKFRKKGSPENEKGTDLAGTNGAGMLGKATNFQRADIKIQHAKFDKMNLPSGVPGMGTGPGPAAGGIGATGSTTSAAGAALPILGAGLAIAGGVLKVISAVGERYTQAVMSQSSTFGATGGYVSGGGGFFRNADVAQANLARGRVTGEDIYGKTSAMFDTQTMKFASSQGQGIAEVVKELETLRKENKHLDIAYVRGAAKASGFTGVRQGEFLSKLAQISETLRGQGYSGNPEAFARFAAGISRGDRDMDPGRRLSLAEQLSNQGRQGVFGGGIFGSLGMAQALKGGGDFFSALREMEEDPGKFMSAAMEQLDAKTRGILGKMNGGSFTEFENLKFKPKDIERDNSEIKAASIKALENQNESERLFSGKGGQAAAQIGYDLNEQMRNMFEKHEKSFTSVATGINKLEEVMVTKIGGQLDSLITMVEKLASGDISGALAEVGNALLSLVSPTGLLVRTKG